MSLRSEARRQAEAFYTEAVRGAFGLIERRIEWRRANAELLALEAHRMADLLNDEPRFVAFRKARVRTWRNRYRKHAARAWAQDQILAAACLGGLT